MQRQMVNPAAIFQGSNKLGLLIALALAIASGVVIFALVRSDRSETPVSTATSPLVTVVTAREGIPAGTRLTADMLTFTTVAQDSVSPTALVDSELAIGQISRIPILAGEPIVAAKLTSASADNSGLSFIIPEGLRAMGIRVDKVISAGGLLRPGDRVDVFAVLSVPAFSQTTGAVVAESDRPVILAQNIEILAVEQELQRVLPTEGNLDRSASEGILPDQAEAQPASTVATLAVTPQQAQLLLFAEDSGTIRLAVRGVGDDTLIPTPEIVFSDFIAETSSHPLTEETSLAFIVPEGYRAMAVKVDKVIGAGGLIRPGDRVDVLAVLEVAIQIQDLGLVDGSARAITLEQNVEVLAVEQALEDLASSAALAAGGDGEQPAAQPSAAVVTLAVTPEVAQAIFLAEYTGEIRLAVRAPGDDTINDVPGTAFFSIRNQLGPVQLLTNQGYVDLLGS